MKTIKICTIIGARPQYIKAAVFTKAIKRHNTKQTGVVIQQTLIHTGQHYDPEMYSSFFDQLDVPMPDIDLGVSGGTNAEQVSRMMSGLLPSLILMDKMDFILVFGDTNSTAAGALVAKLQDIPLIHIEAGLRCFSYIPEELNRAIADRNADLLFCYSQIAVHNLKAEGIIDGVYDVGDITYDSFITNIQHCKQVEHGISGQFYLATVHRAENVDNVINLRNIFHALSALPLPVLIPVHPNTRKKLLNAGLSFFNIHFIDPVSYFEMLYLESTATAIITDSGGMQKEAAWWGVPCITLRNETEEVNTILSGANVLVGTDPIKIKGAVQDIPFRAPVDIQSISRVYGNGETATEIIERIIECALH